MSWASFVLRLGLFIGGVVIGGICVGIGAGSVPAGVGAACLAGAVALAHQTDHDLRE